jgi:dipeptidase D
MGKLDSLQPGPVWRIFEQMNDVPRGSGEEAAVQAMFKAWADARKLSWKEDPVGNLLITIPATAGREKAAPILIQGHVDMVCEKNAGTKHDFTRDPIAMVIEGDWVTAEGTTLGADNGIGVAMGLALADTDLPHGPVEVLLTIDEETGLTGAANLLPGWFASRRMINLDSEEDTAVFVGCAGGRDSVFTVTNRFAKAPATTVGRKITLSGLLGGHSGLDIHRGRGNANVLLARALHAAVAKMPVRIVSFDGGSKRNAIPREAVAVVAVAENRAREFKQLVDALLTRAKAEELVGADDGFAWKLSPAKADRCWSAEASARLLDLLVAIPNGVLAMSRALPGLVETSSNLGVVQTDSGAATITCCSRSSVMSSLDHLAGRHVAIATLAGCAVEQPEGYPGWQPCLDSPLLKTTTARYAKLFGREPELMAVHAGLECGLFTRKYPDLDIVSFGPNIHGAHSPDEKVQISSVQRIWNLFAAVVDHASR